MENKAVLTAVIGASAATIGVIVAKDSKISEFRQLWIDALRDDIANLCATSVALYNGNLRFLLRDRLPELSTVDTSPLVERANILSYRIRLRLDKKKEHSQELIKALNRLVGLATHVEESFDVISQHIEIVMEKSDVVIEDAWATVKRGEPRFRWVFRAAFTSLLIALLLAFWRWLAPH